MAFNAKKSLSGSQIKITICQSGSGSAHAFQIGDPKLFKLIGIFDGDHLPIGCHDHFPQEECSTGNASAPTWMEF